MPLSVEHLSVSFSKFLKSSTILVDKAASDFFHIFIIRHLFLIASIHTEK